MKAAIEHICQRGGELVLLNVRADNAPAYLLYRCLGFVEFDSVTQLRLKAMPLFVGVEHRSPNQIRHLGVQEIFEKVAKAQAVAAETALPPDGA